MAVSIVLVDLCRELGITPSGFFDAQVNVEFGKFQRSVVSLIEEVEAKILEDLEAQKPKKRVRSDEYDKDFDYHEYVERHLHLIQEKARVILEALRDKLRQVNKDIYITKRKTLQMKHRHPKAIICLDEVCGLFDSRIYLPDMKFLALRKALRHHSKLPDVGPHLAMMMCLRCTKEGAKVVYPQCKHHSDHYRWDDLKRVVLVSCGLNLNLFSGMRLANQPPAELDIQESVDVLNQMIKSTEEGIGEKNSSYHQHLNPLG